MKKDGKRVSSKTNLSVCLTVVCILVSSVLPGILQGWEYLMCLQFYLRVVICLIVETCIWCKFSVAFNRHKVSCDLALKQCF